MYVVILISELWSYLTRCFPSHLFFSLSTADMGRLISSVRCKCLWFCVSNHQKSFDIFTCAIFIIAAWKSQSHLQPLLVLFLLVYESHYHLLPLLVVKLFLALMGCAYRCLIWWTMLLLRSRLYTPMVQSQDEKSYCINPPF